MTAFNQSIAAEPPAVLSLVLFHQSTPQDPLKVVTISIKGVKLVIKNGHEFCLSIGLLEQVFSLVLFLQSTPQDLLKAVPMEVKGGECGKRMHLQNGSIQQVFSLFSAFPSFYHQKVKITNNLLC